MFKTTFKSVLWYLAYIASILPYIALPIFTYIAFGVHELSFLVYGMLAFSLFNSIHSYSREKFYNEISEKID